MKTRIGFVSNSSSSSFVVGFKGEITEEKLIEVFKVPKDSPLYFVAEKCAKIFMDSDERIKNIKDYIKYLIDNGCESSDDPLGIEKYLNKDFQFIVGTVGDDSGEAMESMLCEASINYESNDLIIKKEGGY